jgi:hypothetical protein
MTDRYEDDFYGWTQEQAAVLRSMRLADNRLDRDHLAEEIEDLGNERRFACESWCERIIAHLLKLEFSGLIEPMRHWKQEVRAFRIDLRRRLTPALRARLQEDWPARYRVARQTLRDFEEDLPGFAERLPGECPYSFAQVAGEPEEWWPAQRPAARSPRPRR